MFVLGVDPGLSRCGYAVLEARGRGAHAAAIGVITTPPSDPLPQRLAELQRELRSLILEFRPQVVAVERVLFQVNVRTAMSVGQASGIAMAEAAGAGCEVVQYSPNQVKEAVTGYGAADKLQVQQMVQTLLGLAALPEPPDAADAAALALTHLAFAGSATTAGLSTSPTIAEAALVARPGRVKNAVGRAPTSTAGPARSSRVSRPARPSGGLS
jgi:crossover junction endodeoxyribonuclease RuvC